MDYDIIIVGAGPGGLIAGYYAAEKGANVLILDKKQELGKPVRCGEAVIEFVFRDFDIQPKKDLISNYARCLTCYSSKGKKVKVDINLDGYILDRVKFEHHLGTRAKKKGVKIQLDTTVVGLKKNKVYVSKDNGKTVDTVSGNIIIGADGVESRIGRWAGIDTTLKPQDIAICYQVVLENIEVEKETVEFYWGRKYSPHGYIWVFPKSNNTANIGIVTLGSINLNLKTSLQKFIESRAPNSNMISKVAGCVPQALPPKEVVKNNVILVGDAARVAIPVTGGGIGHAMTSGKWAGEVTGDIISNNQRLNKLNNYDKKMNSLRKKITRSYILKQKILKDDDILELLFGIFKPLPYLYKLSPKFIEKYLLRSLRY